MTAKQETISRAHKIATELEAEGWSEVDVALILSMALGLYVEGLEGSHRELRPLVEAHMEVAQRTFDAMRASRFRKEGRA